MGDAVPSLRVTSVSSIAVVAVIGSALLTASPVEGAMQECLGQRVTLLARPGPHILGTPGRDVILGTSGDDDIRSLGGDDVVCGGPGDDVIHGGPGRERLIGGRGR